MEMFKIISITNMSILAKCRRTETDFEKSPHFYVSRRNTRQRDPITTRANRTCCYRISLSYISSANLKKRRLFEICSCEAIGH